MGIANNGFIIITDYLFVAVKLLLQSSRTPTGSYLQPTGLHSSPIVSTLYYNLHITLARYWQAIHNSMDLSVSYEAYSRCLV